MVGEKWEFIYYAGSFYNEIRNPKKMLELLKFIIGTNIVLHFYSWGCEEVVEEYKKEFEDNLVLHGKVSSKEAKEALLDADIMVNLSNNSKEQVPGKVMEYFSMGKPVLNFKFLKDDLGDEDYYIYPLIMNVELNDTTDSGNILDFIKNYSKKNIEFEELKLLYPDSTPEYYCNIIEGRK